MMHKPIVLSLVALLLAVACEPTPRPETPPPAGPTAPSPPVLPEAPQAVLLLGSGVVGKPTVAVNFAHLLFDGSRSSGDGLTYLWEFGDGASSIEPVVRHRMEYAARPPDNEYWRRTARLTVTDKHGRSDSTEQEYWLVSIANATFSDWENRVGEYTLHSHGIRRRLRFNQNGTTLSGWYEGPTDRKPVAPRPIIGTLSDEGVIRARTENGAIEISGVVAWGTGYHENDIVLRLSVKDEMVNGAVLDFIYLYPPY